MQVKELLDAVGQTCDSCWFAQDAGQVQRWVSLVNEQMANAYRVLMMVSLPIIE